MHPSPRYIAYVHCTSSQPLNVNATPAALQAECRVPLAFSGATTICGDDFASRQQNISFHETNCQKLAKKVCQMLSEVHRHLANVDRFWLVSKVLTKMFPIVANDFSLELRNSAHIV